MRPELARIEAVLQQTKAHPQPLPRRNAISFDLKPPTKVNPSSGNGDEKLADAADPATVTAPVIPVPAAMPVTTQAPAPAIAAPVTPANRQPNIRVQPIPTTVEPTGSPAPSSTQPIPTSHPLDLDSTEVAATSIFGKAPSLPAFKPAQSLNSGGKGAIAPADPAFTLKVLETIRQKVLGWQMELDYTRRRIQELYVEGPIVEGWLEAYPSIGDAHQLRPDRVSQLMDYKEKIKTSQIGVVVEVPHAANPQAAQDASWPGGYRFCTLADGGRLVTYPCPPDQVPSLSMAISRYQKLCQLMERQTALETQLQQLTETLVTLQNYLPDSV